MAGIPFHSSWRIAEPNSVVSVFMHEIILWRKCWSGDRSLSRPIWRQSIMEVSRPSLMCSKDFISKHGDLILKSYPNWGSFCVYILLLGIGQSLAGHREHTGSGRLSRGGRLSAVQSSNCHLSLRRHTDTGVPGVPGLHGTRSTKTTWNTRIDCTRWERGWSMSLTERRPPMTSTNSDCWWPSRTGTHVV